LKPLSIFSTLFLFPLLCVSAFAADWKPAAGPLVTRWAKDVSPEKAHPEYPRPQMVRKDWQSLNGLWDYAIRPRGEAEPGRFEGTILVPFPVESSLSGVMKRVGPDNRLWYHRAVSLPQAWRGKRILLHFDAVDWEATVLIDGRTIGTHRGGYSPFTFDVTDSLTSGKAHDLVVVVWDPSDAGTQPCGKQHNKPQGIWYTPSTGIWQTVWLEPVPQTYVKELRLEPDVAGHRVSVDAQIVGPTDNCTVVAEVLAGNGHGAISASGAPGKPFAITIPQDAVRLWSPDSPFLYDVVVRIVNLAPGAVVQGAHGTEVDGVGSYFALRSIAVANNPDGKTRIVLNGKPVFLIGPLDQGFWPDGLYAAPTDEALRSDLEITKKLGFNLVRKHVKVEPARWCYWCDHLGLAVFQDMPSGDMHARENSRRRPEITRSPESAHEYDAELKDLIDSRRHFPCIVAWVPFNEGWGQFDTVRISRWIKEHDPSRLVIPASGWNDFPVGDIHDIHSYPGPAAPQPEAARAAVLGEFGGLGLPVPGHLWINNKKNWGYRKFESRDALTAAYLALAAKLRPLVESRLSAAVYTQTTDVETEVNGLMTYDRELIKMDADKVRLANQELINLFDKPQAAKHE
jgi:beta-galactosidase/beta-glucuronidase